MKIKTMFDDVEEIIDRREGNHGCVLEIGGGNGGGN